MNLLKDLVVLDLTRYEAGPLCTYLLGHMGACILKIEKPFSGDDHRLYPPMYDQESLAFPAFNLNKNSLCLKVRDAEAQEILKRLLPHVDIITQNFRPGTVEKMGLDWETVHKINPRIIMANQSGFGQTGPYTHRAAFDGVSQCEGGLTASISGRSGGKPFYIGGNPCDCMGALNFAMTVLAAVNLRDITGEGQYLEVDMMSTTASLFSPEIGVYNVTGDPNSMYEMYPDSFYHDKNGEYISISCPSKLWEEFKEVVGCEELNDHVFDALEGRVRNHERLDAIIEQWTKRYGKEEIRQILESRGIGAGIVKGYDDLAEDVYLKETGYFRQIECPYVGQIPQPTLPFTISGTEFRYERAPKIGEHNMEILQKFLGMTKEEVDDLTRRGILYQGEHAFWGQRE